MALFSQNMAELAIELAAHDSTYEDMVVKFAEHFYYIAAAMNKPGATACGTRRTGSTTTCCVLPDGSTTRLKVRSMVGLLPLCATTVIEKGQRERIPRAMAQMSDRFRRMPELAELHPPNRAGTLGHSRAGNSGPGQPGATPSDPREDARRERVPGLSRHPSRSRSSTSSILTSSTCKARSIASNTCRRSRIRACLAATPTGAARSGCR